MKTLFTACAFLLLFTLSPSCQNAFTPGVQGEGAVEERTLSLDAFDRIQLSIAAQVFVQPGETQDVRLKGQANILDLLTREVEDGEWAIGFSEPAANYDPLEIHITVPTLEGLGVNGSGNITGMGVFRGLEAVELVISGSGNIEVALESSRLDCTVSGSGDIQVKGKAVEQTVSITGSGNVHSYELEAARCDINITGSGDGQVHATETLDISIVGSGDVYYKGAAAVRSHVVGSGDVHNKAQAG